MESASIFSLSSSSPLLYSHNLAVEDGPAKERERVEENVNGAIDFI